MRDEYDFSLGERGKFYRSDATIHLPVYLEADVQDYFTKKAKLKGVEINVLINDLLKKDISLIEGLS